MATTRHAVPGATRTCPHCRQSILESSAVCPICRHHLRVGGQVDAAAAMPSFIPLQVEGTIRPPAGAGVCEYAVMVSVRDAHGAEVSRQLMGVGALHGDEERTFLLAVEVFERSSGRPAEHAE